MKENKQKEPASKARSVMATIWRVHWW